MPRLTVMLPAFNSGRTIRHAIVSTLAAMPVDSELVFFDDASTDNTLEVVERLTDKRLRIETSHENQGSGRARQEILARSDSLYVANMDADDISFPWRFASLNESDVEISFSSVLRFGQAQPIPRPTRLVAMRSSDSRRALLFHNPFPHMTLLAKRVVVETLGGYRSLKRAQDYDLWLRAAASGYKIRRYAMPGALYRQSASQISRGPNYARDIAVDPRLCEAYTDLFCKLASPQFPLGKAELQATLGTMSTRTYMLAELARQALAFNRSHQKYYERLVSSGLPGNVFIGR